LKNSQAGATQMKVRKEEEQTGQGGTQNENELGKPFLKLFSDCDTKKNK
jgi:hypothetical protein